MSVCVGSFSLCTISVWIEAILIGDKGAAGPLFVEVVAAHIPRDVFADDGVAINTKITTTISRLTSRDFFTVNQQLDVLTFGWPSKGFEPMYFSGGIYQELDAIAYFPKDFAILPFSICCSGSDKTK